MAKDYLSLIIEPPGFKEITIEELKKLDRQVMIHPMLSGEQIGICFLDGVLTLQSGGDIIFDDMSEFKKVVNSIGEQLWVLIRNRYVMFGYWDKEICIDEMFDRYMQQFIPAANIESMINIDNVVYNKPLFDIHSSKIPLGVMAGMCGLFVRIEEDDSIVERFKILNPQYGAGI